jgi:hypothetical protein
MKMADVTAIASRESAVGTNRTKRAGLMCNHSGKGVKRANEGNPARWRLATS